MHTGYVKQGYMNTLVRPPFSSCYYLWEIFSNPYKVEVCGVRDKPVDGDSWVMLCECVHLGSRVRAGECVPIDLRVFMHCFKTNISRSTCFGQVLGWQPFAVCSLCAKDHGGWSMCIFSILPTDAVGQTLLFHTWGNWGTERSNTFPNIAELETGFWIIGQWVWNGWFNFIH